MFLKILSVFAAVIFVNLSALAIDAECRFKCSSRFQVEPLSISHGKCSTPATGIKDGIICKGSEECKALCRKSSVGAIVGSGRGAYNTAEDTCKQRGDGFTILGPSIECVVNNAGSATSTPRTTPPPSIPSTPRTSTPRTSPSGTPR